MSDADSIKPYTPPTTPPKSTTDLPRFMIDELRKVRDADTLLYEVIRKLEARIVALGG